MIHCKVVANDTTSLPSHAPTPERLTNPTPITMPAAATQSADTQQQDYLWTLNFGPQHPATHTTLRIVLKLDGERVVEAVPDIGYLHSGFEKIGEHLDYNQYVTVTDRMNYISPMANNVAWHGSVEKLLNIEPTVWIVKSIRHSTSFVEISDWYNQSR